MKFSAKMVRTLLLFLSLSSQYDSAKANPTLPGQAIEPSTLYYSGLSLDKLEVLEMDRPKDKHLKAALTLAYWCQGKAGVAILYAQWLQAKSQDEEENHKWRKVEDFLNGRYQRMPASFGNCP